MLAQLKYTLLLNTDQNINVLIGKTLQERYRPRNKYGENIETVTKTEMAYRQDFLCTQKQLKRQ